MIISIIYDTEDINTVLEVKNYFFTRKKDIDRFVEVNKNDFEIRSCRACNSCWTKTPGHCVIPDKASDLSQVYNCSDIVVFISDIFYGSYSPWIKSVLERLVPNILPYFETREGKMFHALRNDNYPFCVFIGVTNQQLSEEEKEIFEELSHVNLLNMTGKNADNYLIMEIEGKEFEERKWLWDYFEQIEYKYENSCSHRKS